MAIEIELSDDRETLRVGGRTFKDGASVRVLVGAEWFDGELILGLNRPLVFAPELGHVDLEDAPHSTCIVSEMVKGELMPNTRTFRHEFQAVNSE